MSPPDAQFRVNPQLASLAFRATANFRNQKRDRQTDSVVRDPRKSRFLLVTWIPPRSSDARDGNASAHTFVLRGNSHVTVTQTRRANGERGRFPAANEAFRLPRPIARARARRRRQRASERASGFSRETTCLVVRHSRQADGLGGVAPTFARLPPCLRAET